MENFKGTIIGISCYYHDASACLIKNNKIIAAASEERFTRKKHDDNFPINAMNYCLEEAGLKIEEVDHIVFYEKPFIKFERILLTYLKTWPFGLISFLRAMPLWLKDKLWINYKIEKEIKIEKKILYVEHHISHAASAFFTSPFKKSAIITLDGAGEWTTTTVGYGDENNLKIFKEIHFPDSIGLLYSAATYYLGFKVNDAEYKVMGLAPYGFVDKKNAQLLEYYYNKFKQLIEINEDGSFKLNMKYFSFEKRLKMINRKFYKLFGFKRRKPESEILPYHKVFAAALQKIIEEIILKLAITAKKITGADNLCIAGGVGLNCVANGMLLRESGFKDIYVQPASSDAGGSLGAALFVNHFLLKNKRTYKKFNPLLGPSFSNQDILKFIEEEELVFKKYNTTELISKTAAYIKNKNVVGWFQGRMEYGPRALGCRSILGDARDPKMKDIINLKIKFRESFRPFAPTIIKSRLGEYFDLKKEVPYMLFTAKVKKKGLPSITHVDGSARVQTVTKSDNPIYYKLLKEFESITGCPIIINTSFNIRSEPIVCNPEDAIECFLKTNMDILVIGNYIIKKNLNKDKEKIPKKYSKGK